jgi:hypothetical protein
MATGLTQLPMDIVLYVVDQMEAADAARLARSSRAFGALITTFYMGSKLTNTK